ncbi:NAD(P)H-quinone oxidoreductase [Telmatospirillum siberiense]|uniref:NAD(P)H-quinone oxidoreductase n=1 Tax=Telmatospirillum siberiense TaxID=382514 RepID=A0A2N3Q150_9PROT|nr:NAD(P)H-quinone oxidoreductase [Telmatospirillum siberiense]PKU26367.1 NAD(P)H-quinone oxidoreductase [Telmatospirillum siberiense]
MSLPANMQCVEISTPGGPEVLRVASRPVPRPGPGEVLIRVAAAGVNRPDVAQRMGKYPPPPGAPDLPGLEIAGTIAAIGADAGGLSVGQSVCALVSGGGYAEFCLAQASLCFPFPKGYTAVQAAALPETFCTVWHNVFQRGALKKGESLLVHGGSSGIGTTAIQLAKAFGSTVYTTAGGGAKCQACLDLGADRAIDYKSEDFVQVIAEATGGRGVDVILDMVGGTYLNRNIKCLAPDGRHVSIAFLEGSKAEVNFLPVMVKRLVLTGSTLRPRSVPEKAAIAGALRANVWPLLDQGRLAPAIFATFPLHQAEDAHRLMESSAHIGKIVLAL